MIENKSIGSKVFDVVNVVILIFDHTGLHPAGMVCPLRFLK